MGGTPKIWRAIIHGGSIIECRVIFLYIYFGIKDSLLVVLCINIIILMYTITCAYSGKEAFSYKILHETIGAAITTTGSLTRDLLNFVYTYVYIINIYKLYLFIVGFSFFFIYFCKIFVNKSDWKKLYSLFRWRIVKRFIGKTVYRFNPR